MSVNILSNCVGQLSKASLFFDQLYKNETLWIQSLCFILRQYNMHNNMHPEIEDADVKSSYHPMISCCSKLGYWMWRRSTIIVNSAIYSVYGIWLVQHLDRQEQIREEIYLGQGVRTPYRLLWAHKLKLFVFRSVCPSLINREVNAHRLETMMQITIGLWSWRFWKKKGLITIIQPLGLRADCDYYEIFHIDIS